jgi:hypothetical protein
LGTTIEHSSTTELMREAEGPTGIFAIFSEDAGAGYFCVYQSQPGEVLAQVRIYDSTAKFSVSSGDLQVLWSSDHKKCGVVIWGRMRAVIEAGTWRSFCPPFEKRDEPGVSDPEWLSGFDGYLDQDQFITARARYWKEVALKNGGEPSASEGELPVETNFIVSEQCLSGLFAVFEDHADTGYLYVYDPKAGKVSRDLHVYDRSTELTVVAEDVQVLWAAGGMKCGVVIWERMRGIIDLTKNRPGRVWLKSRSTPSVNDEEWLRGF